MARRGNVGQSQVSTPQRQAPRISIEDIIDQRIRALEQQRTVQAQYDTRIAGSAPQMGYSDLYYGLNPEEYAYLSPGALQIDMAKQQYDWDQSQMDAFLAGETTRQAIRDSAPNISQGGFGSGLGALTPRGTRYDELGGQVMGARTGSVSQDMIDYYINQGISARREEDAARLERNAEIEEQAAQFADQQRSFLQLQADMMRQQRERALEEGLNDVAARYDEQIAGIDEQIAELQRKSADNQAASAWFRNKTRPGFEAARQAAQLIETRGATAAMDEAAKNLTEAKLASDERLNQALMEIGFTGMVGEIGIEALQNEVAEGSYLTEQQGLIAALGQGQEEMAKLQKTIAEANADQIWAQAFKDDEASRLTRAHALREAIGNAEEDRSALMSAKAEALQDVREKIAEQYGEGVALPDAQTFQDMSMRSAFATLAPEMSDDDYESYRDVAIALAEQGFLGPRWRNEAVEAFLIDLGYSPDDFDNEDLGIFQMLAETYDESMREWEEIRKYQGSGMAPGGDNRNEYNRAEVEHWRQTGEINGPYAQRAADTVMYANWLNQQFGGGLEIEGQNYLRPIQDAEEARASGRDPNSDHLTAGALDIYFRDGRRDEEYMRLEGIIQELKRQGIVESFVGLGQNRAHNDHIHISFALPYGGQQDFIGSGGNVNETIADFSGAGVGGTSPLFGNVESPTTSNVPVPWEWN